MNKPGMIIERIENQRFRLGPLDTFYSSVAVFFFQLQQWSFNVQRVQPDTSIVASSLYN